jgi:hypothetical protein
VSIDPVHNTLLLSGPYTGPTATVSLFTHPRDGYQYIVTFDSNLGDLPALTVTPDGLYESSDGQSANSVPSYAHLTACDQYTTQLITTTAATHLNGTFSLSMGGETTPNLPYDVSAAALTSALEAFETVYAVTVVRAGTGAVAGSGVGLGGYAWTVTFVATDVRPSALVADGHLLRGTGARVTVDSDYCPSTAQPNAGAVGQVRHNSHSYFEVLPSLSVLFSIVSRLLFLFFAP